MRLYLTICFCLMASCAEIKFDAVLPYSCSLPMSKILFLKFFSCNYNLIWLQTIGTVEGVISTRQDTNIDSCKMKCKADKTCYSVNFYNNVCSLNEYSDSYSTDSRNIPLYYWACCKGNG